MSEKHSAHNNAKLQTSDPLTVFQNSADELSSQQRKILGYRTRKSCFKDDSTTLLLLLENLGEIVRFAAAIHLVIISFRIISFLL